LAAAQSAAEADGVIPPTKEEDTQVAGGDGEGSIALPVEKQSEDEEEENGGDRNKEDATSDGASLPLPSMENEEPGAAAAIALAIAEEQKVSQQRSSKSRKKKRSSHSSDKKRPELRRGKWTQEEEAYANRLIQEFKAGLLPLTDGTTLRTFLSKLLNCDPMRISKKFVGSNCIGKQIFRRRGADVNNLTPAQVEQTRFELSELEKKFLDRVAQTKSGGSSGGGRGSSKRQRGGGGSGGLNKSAAAVGRAMLQGGGEPSGNADLFSQLKASQPGMFNASQGSLGKFIYVSMSFARFAFCWSVSFMFPLYTIGNMTNTASLANLMLQTGMAPDQISQLAQGGGIASSASLANMLGKQRSFDQLMSLDFQSMQSIDNLANLIQQGMPNQGAGLRGTPARSQMKNMDWGTQGNNNNNNNIAAPQAILNQAGMGGSSFDALVRTLSATTHSTANSGQSGGSGSGGSAFSNTQRTQPNATNFGNLLQNAQGGLAGGQGLSTSAQDFSNILQGLTQQNQQQQQQQQGNANVNFNLGMAPGGNNPGLNQNAASGNMFLNMMTQQMAGGNNNMAQQQQQNNLNPLVMQQLAAGNAQFGGQQTNQINPMMALLAQQQLAQTGNNMNHFLAQPQMMNTNPYASQLASLGSTYNPAPPINQAGVANMPTGNSNAMAFLNNLIQQQGSGGTNNNQASEAPVMTTQGGGGGDNDGSTLVSNKTESTATSGEKRSIDEVVKNDGGAEVEDGEPSTKKQNTTEAV